jgi:hypothetical protein
MLDAQCSIALFSLNSAIRNPCLRGAAPAKALCGGQPLRRRQAHSAIEMG